MFPNFPIIKLINNKKYVIYIFLKNGLFLNMYIKNKFKTTK